MAGIYPTVVTRISDLDGTLRLELAPPRFRRRLVDAAAGTTYSENHTSSAYIGGASEVTPGVPQALKRNEQIRVSGDPALAADEGAYWRDVEDNIVLLEQACSSRFLWTISTGGYLWTYRTVGPASTDASVVSKEDLAVGRRIVILQFTVQPDPVRVNPEEL